MKPAVFRQETLSEGKFLRLELLQYRDCSGRARSWEAVQRCTLPQVVVIIATLRPSGEILLIRQFRPPVNAFVLEFPAGLVDPGESVSEAARRELQEETGYSGQVDWQSSPGASSAGLTGELLTNVIMTVEQSCLENQHPCQNLQDGEEIAVFQCLPAALPEFFQQQLAGGAVLDSRLSAWACAQGLRW
ncbi:MAG: NUDIX hydrolase [Oligosphaeraceae bacterium]|nr:NUDIX hydrolase [Oligosphaeraceae bacterium]